MERIIGWGISLISALWLVGDFPDGHQKAWAQAATVLIMANLSGLALAATIGFGYTTMYPGLAAEAQTVKTVTAIQTLLADIRSDQKENKVRTLDADLVRDYRDFCEAGNTNNPQAKRYAYDRFRDDLQAYYDAAGQKWSIPDCSELL